MLAGTGPDPGTNSIGMGILAADGAHNIELLVFPVVNGRIGGPEFVEIRSRLAVAIWSGEDSLLGGWEMYIAPSAVFRGQREVLFSLDLGLEGPETGSLVLSSEVGPQLQLAMSPSFAVTGVSLAMSVGAEARIPLTYRAEWEEGFLAGVWIAPLALVFMYGLALGGMAILVALALLM